MEFLGHDIGEGAKRASPRLLEKISDAPRPVTKKQVRSFVGLTGFYREYIPHYAEIALPLTQLVGKGMPDKVKWLQEHEDAFQRLKRCLDEPPILKLPVFENLFILKVDASDVGLGAALMQEFEGREFPIAYASKKLLPRECRYATVEKECMAIVWAVKRFDFYLYGRFFEVHTDHRPLIYLHEKRSTNRRLMRWSLVLQEHRFRVTSVPGRANLLADFLSRQLHP